MKLKSLRKNPLFLAAIAASLLSLVGLVIFIPRYTEVQVEKSAIENATILVDHIRTFRAYYNENVLVKIKNNTTMRINYDHKEDNGTLPLPATMAMIWVKSSLVTVNTKSKCTATIPFLIVQNESLIPLKQNLLPI